MEAKEEIYQYIRKNIKEDGVTAQSIAEIFGIKRNVASHYLNLLQNVLPMMVQTYEDHMT